MMVGPKLDYEKAAKQNLVRQRGTEPAEEPRGPQDDTPTRRKDLVHGVTKAARARTRTDREELAKMKCQLEKWLAAPDKSPLEIDKLRRRINALERVLPKERMGSSRPVGMKRRRRRKKKAKENK